MMKAGCYILVHLVESKPIGYQFEKKRESWPLHITLVPWFYAKDTKIDQIRAGLQCICNERVPINAQVGDIELFGPEQNIPVNIIIDAHAILELHTAMLSTVELNDAEFLALNRFVGSEYVSHVTRHEYSGVEQGTTVTVDSVAMISVDDRNMCTVEQIFEIGPHGEKTA